MHTVETATLKAGMITAERVFSNKGQLIVERSMRLTNQMISHIFYYGINSVSIIDSEIPPETIAAIQMQNSASDSYSARVKSSAEYIIFKRNYTKKINFLENSLNDLVKREQEIDTDALLAESISLLSKNNTTISIFDILHNMHQINDSTYAHCMNVAIISRMIGIWLNYSEKELDTLTLCGLLHDIGKCSIDSAILNKPGKLTDQEFAKMKQHPTLGYKILQKLDIDPKIKLAALQHHERCDGSGYPLGLKGKDILDSSMIVSIADIYDAMTADRCYRRGLCPFEVISTFETDGFEKYKVNILTTFLERIANTYINNEVLLSNGQTGKIIMIDRNYLTRPFIQTGTSDFVSLLDHPELYVQAII